jgi:hypothetical protein
MEEVRGSSPLSSTFKPLVGRPFVIMPSMRLRVMLAGLVLGLASMFATVAGAWAVPPVKIAGRTQGNDPIADCGTLRSGTSSR